MEIRDLGGFRVKYYDGYVGKNPKTGESIKVKSKKLPFFKCGKELKERVDSYKQQPKEEMMNQLEKDLKAVAKDLRRLTQKTDRMIKRLEKLEKPQVVKRPKAKAAKKAVAKKPTKLSASGTVLAIIKRSRKGVEAVALEKKTGFESKKIRDITYRLRKQGKIKGVGKGIFIEA